MSKSKMLSFYESLLTAAGLIVTPDGYVSIRTSKESKPLTLKGRRLALPTAEHLASFNRDSVVIFHPLTENIMRGESEVFERFRIALNGRLNVVIGTIMHVLLELSTSPDDQHKLTPEQTEFLSKAKNADAKTVEALKKIIGSISASQQQKLFVSMFIKRGGTVGDKRFSRVGVVHFPFYTDLKKAEPEFHGVKLRVKDRDTLLGLLDYILPEQDIAGVYNRGSNSSIAPSLEALMLSVLAVAAPLNDLLARFDNILPDSLTIDADWVETLNNLDALLPEIRSVPMQAGNEGALPGTEAAATAPTAPAVASFATPGVTLAAQRTATVAPWTTAPMPASAPAPVVRTASGGTDFESLVRTSPGLQQAIGWSGSHGWNAGVAWQQAPTQQRASLSNPSAPPSGYGTQQWGQPQQSSWGGSTGSWGQSNVRL